MQHAVNDILLGQSKREHLSQFMQNGSKVHMEDKGCLPTVQKKQRIVWDNELHMKKHAEEPTCMFLVVYAHVSTLQQIPPLDACV